MHVTTVRVPDELAEQVKIYCGRTGATFNGAVVVALEALTGRVVKGSGVFPPLARPVSASEPQERVQTPLGFAVKSGPVRKAMCEHRIGPDAFCGKCDA